MERVSFGFAAFKPIRLALVLCAMTTPVASAAEPLQLYVATDGNDAWSGTLAKPNAAGSDGPLATIAHARDVLRQRKTEQSLENGATVTIRGGTYIIDNLLEFGAEDSGTADAPIIYRSAPEATVRLLAGRIVNNWQPVTDADVLQQLDESARDNVQRADLKALGITDFGSPAGGGMEFFFGGRPMTLARWPNDGFASIVDVLGPTPVDVRGTKGTKEGLFRYDGDRPRRWASEPDAWVHGYWFWDWSEQRHPIKSIDADNRIIEVQPPYHGYGYRKNQWFYAFNLLSELDSPGEWYLDRSAGVLYFWPPSPVDEAEAIVSVLPTLLSLKDVSHVEFRNFTLEAARDTAVRITGGTETRIVGCTIRNVGGWGVSVSGGERNSVIGCDMFHLGAGGVSMSGGDRVTLTPAGHLAENNHIHHYARINRVYRPGITLQGVGNRAAHNLIHHAPHMAMGFGGNDHRIEFNEIHHVCEESNDAGAIYTGRDWTQRGTVIRHNYLHDITGFRDRGCVGVYLDDMFCGTEVSGNLFYRVTNAAFIGGGRDCVVTNNLFVDCRPALHIDARALGWAHDHSDAWIQEAREQGTLSGIKYNQPPYSERYPELVDILNQTPAAPEGNRVTRNVSFGGKWDGVSADARAYQTIENNLVDVDPHFTTPERIGEDHEPRPTDFALQPDSPAWEIGFEPLPLEEIGLYDNESRAVSTAGD